MATLTEAIQSVKEAVAALQSDVTRIIGVLESGDTATAVTELEGVKNSLEGMNAAIDAAAPPA